MDQTHPLKRVLDDLGRKGTTCGRTTGQLDDDDDDDDLIFKAL
jgi:hypothetical protein